MPIPSSGQLKVPATATRPTNLGTFVATWLATWQHPTTLSPTPSLHCTRSTRSFSSRRKARNAPANPRQLSSFLRSCVLGRVFLSILDFLFPLNENLKSFTFAAAAR